MLLWTPGVYHALLKELSAFCKVCQRREVFLHDLAASATATATATSTATATTTATACYSHGYCWTLSALSIWHCSKSGQLILHSRFLALWAHACAHAGRRPTALFCVVPDLWPTRTHLNGIHRGVGS